jgi:hypothetical protein
VFENTSKRWRRHWAHQSSAGGAGDNSGSTGDKSGSADDQSGSADVKHGSTWERQQNSILGKTSFSFETLLVHLETIANTYRSTVFKTHAFSLYSHLSIDIATNLYTVYVDWVQAALDSNWRCV